MVLFGDSKNMKKLLASIIFSLCAIIPATAFAQTTAPNGGTGLTSYTAGDIIYAATTNPIRFTKLPVGGNGTCLGVVSNLPAYIACGSGSGGGAGTFSTTSPFGTTQLQYPTVANTVTSLDTSATTTSKWWFDPIIALQKIVGSLWVTGSTTLNSLSVNTATTSNLTILGVPTSSILKTNGIGQVTNAISGTDYQPAGTYVTNIGPTGQLQSNSTITIASSTTGTDFSITGSVNTLTWNLPTASASNRGLLSSTDWTNFNNKGSGTVTAVSVASANGLAGSSSGGATPTLTLSTTINSNVLKGNGTAISGAVNGTDYTLLNATSCAAGTTINAVTAAGGVTCGNAFSTTSANAFIVASTTIPTGTPILGNVFLGNGTNWTSVATSSLGITGGGSTPPGGSTGQLQYNASGSFGGVATTSVTCSGTVTCTSFNAIGASPITINGSAGTSASSTLLSDNNGFSGNDTFTNASTTLLTLRGRTYDINNSAGAAGFVLMSTASGVQWVATSSVNNGVTSLAQTYGTAQTGAATFATSSDSFNGLNANETITNSGNTFTFANNITGTLTAGGGGTGISNPTAAGVLLGSYAGGAWQQLSTSSLHTNFADMVGTVSNAQLANSSVSYGGVSVSLGSSNASPAFNLASATGLPLTTGITGTLPVANGGTGITSLTSSNLLYGAGTGAVQLVATTSVTCSGSTTCSPFTVIGSSPITISSTGGASGAAGTWSTTTSQTPGTLVNYSNNSTDIVSVGGNSTTTDAFYVDPNASSASLGVGTSSPYAMLSVAGRGVFDQDIRANLYTATSTTLASTFPYASTTAISSSNLTSGNCVQAGTGGLLTTTGSACGSGGSGAAYPFQVSGNATSTLTQFNGGLTAYASTTIGGGATTAGLTVNGFSTTTLGSYVGGNLAAGGTISAGSFFAIGNPFGGNYYTNSINNTGFYMDGGNGGIGQYGMRTAGGGAGSDYLALRAGNVDTLFINAFTNNVGIGTTSPYAKLSVDGRGVFNQDVRANYFTATSTTNPSVFTGGLTALASSTIGAGGQATGLTVNGGATTTAALQVGLGATTAFTIASTGNVGIASTSPWGLLSIVGNTSPVLVVATSTVSASSKPIFEIDANGHQITSGPTPAISGGTSSVSGNDNNGTITVTGTLLTSVTLTFANAWGTAPDCTMSDSTTGVTSDISSISTTQLVIGFSAGVNSASVWYVCRGHQ